MGSWACQTCREDGDDGSGACSYLSIRGTVLLRDWADQRLPRQTQRVDRQATACPLHVSRLKELDVGDRLTALGEPPRGGCVAKMLPLRLRWAARAPVRAARAPVRAPHPLAKCTVAEVGNLLGKLEQLLVPPCFRRGPGEESLHLLRELARHLGAVHRQARHRCGLVRTGVAPRALPWFCYAKSVVLA